jgi:SET domain-containing protein
MLTVPTYVKKSPINGKGIFSVKFIPQDTIIWIFNPEFDLMIPLKLFMSFDIEVQEIFHHYGFLDVDTNKIILCNDNARFTNHSINPNTQSSSLMETITIKDIQIGEEITENYFFFDGWAYEKLMG